MTVGLGVLLGLVSFLCVEKFVRIMKVNVTLVKITFHLVSEVDH